MPSSISDIVEDAAGTSHDERLDTLVAWLWSQEERLSKLEGREDDSLEAVSAAYSAHILKIKRKKEDDPPSFYRPLDRPPDESKENYSQFRKARYVCRSFTVFYFLSWVAVQATLLDKTATVFNWGDARVKNFHEIATVIEFMFTGIAESATIMELLITLPSKRSGPEAVWHFRLYELIFAVGTATLYGRLGHQNGWAKPYEWGHIPAYIVIHAIKALLVGWMFGIARMRLYDRYATARYKQAARYLADLLRIIGVQVTLFLIMIAGFTSGGVPSTARLLAATTLSVSLPQSFMLTVCLRDTGGISADRLARLKLFSHEAFAFVAIALYAFVGIFAYFLAIEAGDSLFFDVASTSDAENAARWFYYIACICYLVAAAMVGQNVVKRKSRDEEQRERSRRAQEQLREKSRQRRLAPPPPATKASAPKQAATGSTVSQAV